MTDLPCQQDDLNLLCAAGAKAAAIAMRHFKTKLDVMWKDGMSPVTNADLEVDACLKDFLTAARPAYGWLSEETADSNARLSARRTFVVDPIDGTRAFMAGKDVWCVSIAIVEDGRSIAAYLNCPARGEIFTALPDHGARLNGSPMQKLKTHPLTRITAAKPILAALPPAFAGHCLVQPSVPSLAYRIAMIAAGRLDATIVKPDSHDWDLAASELILRECGGAVLAMNGRAPLFASANTAHGMLIAAGIHLAGRLLEAAKYAAPRLSPALAS